MTKARLIMWIDWDPDKTGIGADLPGANAMEIDIEVTDPDKPVTIEIQHDKLVMNTPYEPRFVTMPQEATDDPRPEVPGPTRSP